MRIQRGVSPGPFQKYQDYKSYLRPIFRARCAYCLMPDDRFGGIDGMTVDHFRPRDRYAHLLLNWENLYYSCSICNSHYKKNHPTEDEEADGLRFVDPCEEDPDDHFRLIVDPRNGQYCVVRALSSAAEYTVCTLRLNNRKSLRDFWRELDQQETKLAKRLAEIERRLDDVQSAATSGGERIREDFLIQQDECLKQFRETMRNRKWARQGVVVSRLRRRLRGRSV